MSLNSHQRTKSLLVNPEAGQLKNIRDQHAENAFTRYMSSFGSQSRPESPSKHFSNLSASGYFSDSGTTTTQLEGDVRHHTRHNHGIDVFNLHGNPLHRSHSMPQKEQSLKGEDQKQMLGEYGILSHQRHHNQFQNQSLNHHQSERHSNFQLNHSTQNQYNQYQQQQQQQQQIHNHLSAIQVNSIQQQSNYNENHNQYSQVESSAMHDMNHTLLNPVTFKNGLHLQRNKMMSTSKPISEQLPLLPETPKNNTLYLKTHDNIFASTCRYWYSATCNRGLGKYYEF